MWNKNNIGLVAIISLLFFLQCIFSMKNKVATFDEIGHVAAGYSFLKYNDYRLYDVDPPLMRQIAAFPLLFMNLSFPINSEGWEKKKEIDVGYDFFYKLNSKKADRMLFWARLPIVFVSFLFGILILKFATELWNINAGIFAFFLFSFEPNIIAHARLATTDIGLSFFILLAIYFTYHYWKQPTLKYIIFMGVSFGLAISSKTSGMILIVYFFLIMLLIRPLVINYGISASAIALFKKIYINKNIFRIFGQWLLVLIIGFMVLSMDYGLFKTWPVFRDENDLQKFELSLDKVHINSPKSQTKAVYLAKLIRVPARPFIVSFVKWFGFLPRTKSEGKVQGYQPYFMGKKGRFFIFPFIAFFIKEPIPTILLILLGSILLIFHDWKKFVFLFLPVILFLSMDFKVHPWTYRYLNLPTLSFLILIAAGGMAYLHVERNLKALVGILAVWVFVETVIIFPHYLAYFNETIGGPGNGYKYLVNSNLDWGQDLKLLKDYIIKNKIKDLNLSYFGSASPEYYGIVCHKMLGVNGRETGNISLVELKKMAAPRTGTIAISATCLENIDGFFPGISYRWLKKYKPVKKLGYSIFIYKVETKKNEKNEIANAI